MQEPSLEGLQAPGESPAATTEYTSQQKLAVAAGVAAIGAYVGYTVVQAYRMETPQALWASAPRALSTTSPAAAAAPVKVALVNLHEDERLVAREGLHTWLDLHTEVQLSFPTVMFVEEEEASTFGDITANVRRATLFAHAELQHSREDSDGVRSPSAAAKAAPRRCTVVYRSVVEVDGQPLEDWDIDAAALRRWHGKSFVQRHCLGFTLDGAHATLLTCEVGGVLQTTKLGSATGASKVSLHDGAALLRECGVPSTTTFHQWGPLSKGHTVASSSESSMAFESTPTTEKAEVLKMAVPKGRLCSLWRSAFSVFSLLGAVLRYNRSDFAVYPALLRIKAADAAAAGSGSLQAGKAWWDRVSALLWRRGGEGHDGFYQRRRRLLSAPFLLLVRVADGSATPSVEVMKEVQSNTLRWVRHFSTVADKHAHTLVEMVREKGGQWGLRVDLMRQYCTVVEAEWLTIRVAGLLAAVGIALVNVRLVAVPEKPTDASLLYPSPESEKGQHYWKPLAAEATPTKGASPTAGAKLSESPASTSRNPNWISVEVRGVQKSGFVVAQHDFALL